MPNIFNINLRKSIFILLFLALFALGIKLLLDFQFKKEQLIKQTKQPEIKKTVEKQTLLKDNNYAKCWISDYPEPKTQKCDLIGEVLEIKTEKDGIISILLGSSEKKHIIVQDPKTKRDIHKNWQAKLYFPPDGWIEPDWKGKQFRNETTKKILGSGNSWFLKNVELGARLRVTILVWDGSEKTITDYGQERVKTAYELNKVNIETFLTGENEVFEFWPANIFIFDKD